MYLIKLYDQVCMTYILQMFSKGIMSEGADIICI